MGGIRFEKFPHLSGSIPDLTSSIRGMVPQSTRSLIIQPVPINGEKRDINWNINDNDTPKRSRVLQSSVIMKPVAEWIDYPLTHTPL